MEKQYSHPPELPACPGLDIGALSGMFDNTTASYKFLWSLSILDLVNEYGAVLPAKAIARCMLEKAEPLLKTYHLRFGKQDRMEEFIDLRNGMPNGELPDRVFSALMQFVPYRLLTPFLGGAFRDLNPAALHREIRKQAGERFESDNPALYRFIGEEPRIDNIELHPRWLAYIRQNAGILQGWIMWHWMLFLEARNPSRPNIAQQISPDTQRDGIGQQRDFWRKIISWRGGNQQPVKCLYSGRELNIDRFALDHYVPFGFILHNRLWNLHPVGARANSSKSDSLPHESYFKGFTELQYNALIICKNNFRDSDIKEYALNEYGEGLHLDMERDITEEQVHNAYKAIISPLLTIAQSYGFTPGWKYNL